MSLIDFAGIGEGTVYGPLSFSSTAVGIQDPRVDYVVVSSL